MTHIRVFLHISFLFVKVYLPPHLCADDCHRGTFMAGEPWISINGSEVCAWRENWPCR